VEQCWPELHPSRCRRRSQSYLAGLASVRKMSQPFCPLPAGCCAANRRDACRRGSLPMGPFRACRPQRPGRRRPRSCGAALALAPPSLPAPKPHAGPTQPANKPALSPQAAAGTGAARSRCLPALNGGSVLDSLACLLLPSPSLPPTQSQP